MKRSITRAIFTIVIAMLPLFAQYAGAANGVSFAETILLPFVVAYVLTDAVSGKRKPGFYGLYIVLGFVLVVNFLAMVIQPYSSISSSLTVVLRLVFYGLVIYVARSRVYFRLLCLTLVFGALFNSIYVLMQYAIHSFNGSYLPITIPFLQVAETEGGVRLDLDQYYMWGYRPSGLFLEPSYAALFSLPGVAIALLDSDLFSGRYTGLTISALISIALLASSSSMGLIGLILIWFVYVLKKSLYVGSGGEVRIKPPGILLGMAVLLLGGLLLFSSLGESTVSRISSGGSFGQRVIRGFELIAGMDLRTLIIGTGLNNTAEYVNYYSLYTSYDETNLGYITTYFGALLNSGVLALVGYVVFYMNLIRHGHGFPAKTISILFAVLCIAESMLYSYRFAFYVVIIFAYIDANNHTNALEASHD